MEANETTWKKFDTILATITKYFDDETENMTTDEKLQKLYSHLERAMAIVRVLITNCIAFS